MFQSFSSSNSDIGRKNITLKCQNRKTFQCHKLKLIKIIYARDHDHRLVELVWSLERSFPDVNIEVIKDDEESDDKKTDGEESDDEEFA